MCSIIVSLSDHQLVVSPTEKVIESDEEDGRRQDKDQSS